MIYLLVRFTFPTASTHTYSSAHPAGGSHPLAYLPSPASLQAQDASQRNADLHQLLAVSAIALAAMAVVSLLLGWLIAGRVLRPLRTITATARDLSSATLDRRLALPGPDDELKELGDTFDDLLGRLEQSFDSQRQFVANASHELRTPLTLERALLEAAIGNGNATATSLRGTCERLLVANAEQERLIEALLTLATSERGVEVWEPLDLAELTGAVLDSRRGNATCLELRLETVLEPALCTGDSELVERLVANLVENALRYNTPGGRVEIVTWVDTEHALISVGNTGPQIPPDRIDDLFRPFQRLGDTRTRHDHGHGLGLSIVAAVATAHHAHIVARPGIDGGLDVTVGFPTAATGDHSQKGSATVNCRLLDDDRRSTQGTVACQGRATSVVRPVHQPHSETI